MKKRVEVFKSPGGIITFIEPGQHNANRDRGFFGDKIGERNVVIDDQDEKDYQKFTLIVNFVYFLALVLIVALKFS